MQPAQPSAFEMLLPFVFIFVIFYFLIIRPQGKKLKAHDKFLGELKRGDSVVTAGGILGTIDGLSEHYVTLEVDTDVKIKVLRKQISASQAQAQQDTNSKK